MTTKKPAKLSLLEIARESLRISAAKGRKPNPIDTATNLAMWDLIAGVRHQAEIVLDVKIARCEAELKLKKLELEQLLAERASLSQSDDSPAS